MSSTNITLKHIYISFVAMLMFASSKGVNLNVPPIGGWFKSLVEVSNYKRPDSNLTFSKFNFEESKIVISKPLKKKKILNTNKKVVKSLKKPKDKKSLELNSIVIVKKKINLDKQKIFKNDFSFKSPSFITPKKLIEEHLVIANPNIEHNGFKFERETSKDLSWAQYIEQYRFGNNQKLEGYLASLDKEMNKKSKMIKEVIAQSLDNNLKNFKEDKVSLKVSSIKKLEKDVEPIFYDYSPRVVQASEGANNKDLVKKVMLGISTDFNEKKLLVSKNVRSVIDREMNRQDSWNLSKKMTKVRNDNYSIPKNIPDDSLVPVDEIDDLFKSSIGDYPEIKILANKINL